MHPPNCRCVICLVDRSSFGTPAAKAARESVSAEAAARVVARAREFDERRRWLDWLATIGYGIDFGVIGGAEPPCSLGELADAYVRVTGEEDAETWAWTITQETASLSADQHADGPEGHEEAARPGEGTL